MRSKFTILQATQKLTIVDMFVLCPGLLSLGIAWPTLNGILLPVMISLHNPAPLATADWFNGEHLATGGNTEFSLQGFS